MLSKFHEEVFAHYTSASRRSIERLYRVRGCSSFNAKGSQLLQAILQKPDQVRGLGLSVQGFADSGVVGSEDRGLGPSQG